MTAPMPRAARSGRAGFVVVSHRPGLDGWHPEAPYHFVDGIYPAVDLAKDLAGEREIVGVAAGGAGGS